MKPGPPNRLSGHPPGRASRLSIGSIAVSGVGAATAGRLAAAIEQAFVDATRSGAVPCRNCDALHLELPQGADEKTIASALARALGKRR